MSDTTAPQGPGGQKNLFAALFDLSFTEWVTLRVAGFLYIVTIVIVMIVGAVSFLGFLAGGPDTGVLLLGLLGWPLGLFVAILLVRLTFEATIALVAVAQNTASMRGK